MKINHLLYLFLGMLCCFTACTSKPQISFHIDTEQDKQRSANLSIQSEDDNKATLAFENFAADFNKAIVNDERAALASLCRFPFEFIETKEEFISNFDTYFNADLLSELRKTKPENWVQQDKLRILTVSYNKNKVIFQATLKGDKYYLNEISIIDKNK